MGRLWWSYAVTTLGHKMECQQVCVRCRESTADEGRHVIGWIDRHWVKCVLPFLVCPQRTKQWKVVKKKWWVTSDVRCGPVFLYVMSIDFPKTHSQLLIRKHEWLRWWRDSCPWFVPNLAARSNSDGKKVHTEKPLELSVADITTSSLSDHRRYMQLDF